MPVFVNKDEETFAEIDSDSHINLISEDYFNFLSKNTKIEYLQEPPTSFSGMGSNLKSSYPPIMLNVQVGSVVLKARFVVTDLLKSSKILLGTDFLIKNRIAIGAIGPKNTWECTVSPEGKVLTKISGKVTNKLSLELMKDLTLAPCDVRRVALTEGTSEKADTVLSVSPIYQEYPSLKTSVKNSRLVMENHSLQPAALFNGFPLIEWPATGIG